MGEERVKLNEPLSRHTTLQIGGPADLLYETRDSGELIKAVRLAQSFGIPLTIIGGGSNILVSDLGIRGLVVKNIGGKIHINTRNYFVSGMIGTDDSIEDNMARWMASEKGTMKYDFTDLDYREDEYPDIEVVIDSGVNLQFAMTKLIDEGITGLQWYGRIPGTLGGAVYNNIHGGSHVFSEIVKEVVVLDEKGEVKTLGRKDLNFDYDKSRFHKSKETIIEVRLALKKGDSKRAKAIALEWIKRKSVQPMNSAGCVFKNIGENEMKILGYPTTAIGYIVEHILNMSGYQIGGAVISKDHHNFIVNKGGATAKDFLAVRNEIARRALEILGLSLEDEVIFLGDFG